MITQKFIVSSFLMLLIKTVLFTFALQKKRIRAKNTGKGFDFMNTLPVSKNVKIILKYDKSLKTLTSFF